MDLPKATLTVSMLSFPSDRIVGAISRLVYEFCRALIRDQDMAERFYMAAQELAENLVKYSSGPEVSLSAGSSAWRATLSYSCALATTVHPSSCAPSKRSCANWRGPRIRSSCTIA